MLDRPRRTVVGTGDATQRLLDGDLVLVDGSRGRVEVVQKGGEPHGA